MRTRSLPLRSVSMSRIAAAAMGSTCSRSPTAVMRDDIHAALSRGDKDHASELMVLRHFLAPHPEAHATRTA